MHILQRECICASIFTGMPFVTHTEATQKCPFVRSFAMMKGVSDVIPYYSSSVATVSRIARRLNRTSAENARAFGIAEGILEAKTVHGQVLKVHFSDVANKADLLLDTQRRKMEEIYESHAIRWASLVERPSGDVGSEFRKGRCIVRAQVIFRS